MRFRTFLNVESLSRLISWLFRLMSLLLMGYLVISLVINPLISSLTPKPFTEFKWPDNATSSPAKIIAGPDGALWVTTIATHGKNQIGRITTQGKITLFSVPEADNLAEITAGPDGAVWFTGRVAGKIGRITTQGKTTEFSPGDPNLELDDITTGPDGALWVAGRDSNTDCKILRLTPQGKITRFDVPHSISMLENIIAGPDGAIWFTADRLSSSSLTSMIGRISMQGKVTLFDVRTPSLIWGMVAGPDGAIWFTAGVESSSGKKIERGMIGRISMQGKITEFAGPKDGAVSITVGPDRAFWFTERGPSNNVNDPSKIGRMTLKGQITEFAAPFSLYTTPGDGIVAEPDGTLWFTNVNAIVRLTPPPL